MKPRSRDKKIQEEWVVPLKKFDDISEVWRFCLILLSLEVKHKLPCKLWLIESFISEIHEILPWATKI